MVNLDAGSETQAICSFGDAVCVPVVRWIAHHYLAPVLEGRAGSSAPRRTKVAYG